MATQFESRTKYAKCRAFQRAPANTIRSTFRFPACLIEVVRCALLFYFAVEYSYSRRRCDCCNCGLSRSLTRQTFIRTRAFTEHISLIPPAWTSFYLPLHRRADIWARALLIARRRRSARPIPLAP